MINLAEENRKLENWKMGEYELRISSWDSRIPFAAVNCDFQKWPLLRTHSAIKGTPK